MARSPRKRRTPNRGATRRPAHQGSPPAPVVPVEDQPLIQALVQSNPQLAEALSADPEGVLRMLAGDEGLEARVKLEWKKEMTETVTVGCLSRQPLWPEIK